MRTASIRSISTHEMYGVKARAQLSLHAVKNKEPIASLTIKPSQFSVDVDEPSFIRVVFDDKDTVEYEVDFEEGQLYTAWLDHAGPFVDRIKLGTQTTIWGNFEGIGWRKFSFKSSGLDFP